MGLIHRLYEVLVNRVPGIRQRYLQWRETCQGIGRALAWGYLLALNFRWYILRDRSLEKVQPPASRDAQIRLPDAPESDLGFGLRPEELAQSLLAADVVSFDVFDTLILRPFREPADLFHEVGRRLRCPGFRQLRQEAEQQARRQKGGNGEVTLEEIWQVLSRICGLPAQEGIETEWQTELECCCANPYFLDVVERLHRAGARMVVCSDMYLGQARIEALLRRSGYPPFEQVFVSCDHGTSKSEGGLYRVLKEAIGPDKACLHVGDNPHADWKQAEKMGFRTVRYPNVNQMGKKLRCTDLSPLVGSAYAGIVNGHLYTGAAHYSPAYELGFVYGGLLVTGYCQFIHDHAQANGIEHLLFLARDGQILHRAYVKLYPQEAERCSYVLWSRLAAVKLCADRFRHQYRATMLLHKADHGYSLESVLRTMELEDMLPGFLDSQKGSVRASDLLNRVLAGKLWAYLEENWDAVLAHYAAQSAEGGRYYASVLKGAASAAAIDVGWVGSGGQMLRYMIEDVWKLNCRVTSIVAGTCSQSSPERETSEADLADGSMVSYLFSSRHNRDIWGIHDAALGHNMLVELLLCGTTPSFRGFRKDGQGNYEFNTVTERIDSQAVQQGILDFVECWQRHPWHAFRISGRDAMAPIRVLYSNSAWVRRLIRESGITANIE